MKPEKKHSTGEKMKEKYRLSSKPIALVTGSASFLGSAISRKLAAQGFNIALHYGKSKFKTVDLKQELESSGAEVLLVQANLGNPNLASQLIQKIVHHWGRVDVVVNNASIFEPTTLTEKDFKKWNQIFNVNTFSPVSVAIAAKPWLEKYQGCVINITDIYGEFPVLKEHAAYSASKAALIFLTKYLALALGDKIRVNAVSPGVITFPKHYSKVQRKRLVEKSALKRQGSPNEIADAVWFLVSNHFVSGQVLHVDGGRFTS
jgi:pteridine reductase